VCAEEEVSRMASQAQQEQGASQIVSTKEVFKHVWQRLVSANILRLQVENLVKSRTFLEEVDEELKQVKEF